MQNRYPLYAVLVLCLAAGRLLADPLLVPTKDNGKQPLKVTLTDDNRGIWFASSESGRDKLFHVCLSYSQALDPHGLKSAGLLLEVLDQYGKLIPITLRGDGDFTLIGSMGGGTASVAYKITPDAAQVPTSVNVTWRGKQQHIVLTADNYFKL